MNNQDNSQAFPVSFIKADPITGQQSQVVIPGMTLLDYFAAAALQGLLASVNNNGQLIPTGNEGLSCKSYEYAEAMLQARKKYFTADDDRNSKIVKS